MGNRCEAKDYSQVRVKTGGRVNRTTRCTSKDTNRAILDPRNDHYATYVARGDSEAWFCDEHRGYMGAVGISKWMPAPVATDHSAQGNCDCYPQCVKANGPEWDGRGPTE